MKKALLVGMAAGLLALGIQSKAEAALATSFHICQSGFPCVDVGPGGAIFTTGGITVGDYSLSASGAAAQTTLFAQSQTTNIQVQRNGTTNGNALDVWVVVTGYTQPSGPIFVMQSTATATKSGLQTDPVSYTAWYSSTNASGFPTGTLGTNGSCSPTVVPFSSQCGGDQGPVPVGAGSALYSLISRTTFNIAIGDASLFGSNAQTTITTVPEPMSVMLLGTGLLGLSASIRRRMKK